MERVSAPLLVVLTVFGVISCEDIPRRAALGEPCDENTLCRSGSQCLNAVCEAIPKAMEPDGAVTEPTPDGDVSDAAGPAIEPEAALPPMAGCADNSREGFVDQTRYPHIAGCSGAWTEKGLWNVTLLPRCGRQSGNDLGHGLGCSAEDLCAAGWHVCRSLSEMNAHGFATCDDGAVQPGTLDFFAMRQYGEDLGSDRGTACTSSEKDRNNVFGCGFIGAPATHESCGTLRMLVVRPHAMPDCNSYPPWDCGSDGGDELSNVRKLGVDKGGVICCQDLPR